MKRILLIFIILFSFTVNSFSKIVFIDVNLILNTSDVGKALKKYIKQVSNEHSIDFNRIEKNLVTKEQELIAQQNIIDKSEFEKKLSDLSEEINKYRSNKKLSDENLNEIKLNNTKKILKLLNPIITEYVDKNSISLVLPKKNIIVGKKNLDITNDIVILLNQQVTDLNFK